MLPLAIGIACLCFVCRLMHACPCLACDFACWHHADILQLFIAVLHPATLWTFPALLPQCQHCINKGAAVLSTNSLFTQQQQHRLHQTAQACLERYQGLNPLTLSNHNSAP